MVRLVWTSAPLISHFAAGDDGACATTHMLPG